MNFTNFTIRATEQHRRIVSEYGQIVALAVPGHHEDVPFGVEFDPGLDCLPVGRDPNPDAWAGGCLASSAKTNMISPDHVRAAIRRVPGARDKIDAN